MTKHKIIKRSKIIKRIYDIQHDMKLSDLDMLDAVYAWLMDTAQTNGYVLGQQGDFDGTRRFYLRRDLDVSGISGTGTVADGVVFRDGVTVIRWRGDTPSTVVWSSLEHAHAVHGHGGFTKFVFLDEKEKDIGDG